MNSWIIPAKGHAFTAKGFCADCGEFIFTDVTASKASNAVAWAAEAGIINTAKKFYPDRSITRKDIVMILWKMTGSRTVSGVSNPFSDVTGNKTMKTVLRAYKNGITKGASGSTFSPGTPD